MSRTALLRATCLSGLALAASMTPAVADDLLLDASSLTETAPKTYRYVWIGNPNGPSNYVIQNTSVTAEYSIVGYGSGNNSATITGAEALWNSPGYIIVGAYGSNNRLLVEGGGRLTTANVTLGDVNSTGNTVTVTGAGSTVNGGSIVVGNNDGGNTLSVEEGGTITVADVLIGYASSGNTVNVTGADSRIESSTITIGFFAGLNTLRIDDGGMVIGGQMSVNGNSTITLGAGSVLEAGSLTLSPQSEFGIYLDDERNARLTIAGTAKLDGTLKVSIGTDKLRSKRYTVLTAGTVTGTFDTLSFGTLADGFDDTILATATLDYSGDLVSLLFEADIGGRNSLSDNQSNVATAINRYFNAGGTLPESFVPLFLLTDGALTSTLDQLSGEVGASGGAAVANDAMSDFLGLLITADAPGPQQAASANLGGMTVIPAADVAPSSGWSMWGKAFGGTANLPGDADDGSTGTDTGLFGFATGWDHALTSDATLGFAIAGGGTRWDVDNGLGEGESTFLQLGAHGAQRFGASYLSLAGAYAWHWMETERRALSGTLTAEFMASTIGGRIEAGHRFAAHDDLGLTPYAALQAQATFLPDYGEDGGAAALDFDEKTTSTTRSELGLKVDMTADAVRLTTGLAWAHDWTSDAEIDASFQSLPGAAFTVSGAEAPDNIALASLGLEASLSDRASISGSVEGELGEDYSSLAGTIALRFSW